MQLRYTGLQALYGILLEWIQNPFPNVAKFILAIQSSSRGTSLVQNVLRRLDAGPNGHHYRLSVMSGRQARDIRLIQYPL